MNELCFKLRSLISKLAKWGKDEDGDLTLRVGFLYITFYKYEDPLIRFRDLKFSSLKNVKRTFYGIRNVIADDNERED